MKANPLDVTQYIMENSKYGIHIAKVYSLLYFINGMHLAINDSPMMDLEFYEHPSWGDICCDFLPPEIELENVRYLYAPELTVGDSDDLTSYQKYFIKSVTSAYNFHSSIELNELAKRISTNDDDIDNATFATSTEQIKKCFDDWCQQSWLLPKKFKD